MVRLEYEIQHARRPTRKDHRRLALGFSRLRVVGPIFRVRYELLVAAIGWRIFGQRQASEYAGDVTCNHERLQWPEQCRLDLSRCVTAVTPLAHAKLKDFSPTDRYDKHSIPLVGHHPTSTF